MKWKVVAFTLLIAGMANSAAPLPHPIIGMAPRILDIPSPVVGNAENVTPAQGFVYPDAIDLTKYVTDQESNSSQIIWSYEIIGTPKYKINNVGSMNPMAGDDPIAPGVKSLNNAVTGGEADFDHNPLTITIRNIDLSPVIGQIGTVPGTPPGILPNESQQVVFFASDQTTWTATDGARGHANPVWFYTANNVNDYLMPTPTPTPTPSPTVTPSPTPSPTPSATPTPTPRPTEVWVNFSYGGTELGTSAQPFNTLGEGLETVANGGTIRINGGSTGEKPRITQNVRLLSAGGTVRIGVFTGP